MRRAPPVRLLLLLVVGIALCPGGPLRGSLAQEPAAAAAAANDPAAAAAAADADPAVAAAPAAAAAGGNGTNVTTVTQECVSYSAGIADAVRSADGSAVMSAILVPDNISVVVGAVDVQDLSVVHSRLGALMVTLHWLPYAATLENINPRELEEVANATAILKDIRQGGPGANISSVSFTDEANTTIPAAPTDNLSGNYTPATPLRVFSESRLPSRGRWVLVVEDVGSGHKNRSITLNGWRLVLCPGLNETLPPSLREQMAQQAVGAFDLSSARVGAAFSAAVRQAASGPFGARAASQPLAAAVGTLVTRDATITYKTYSQLADAAVDDAIRVEDNIQLLFGLPYEPAPLIDQWLPWVELLIGGTDLTIQNTVWPGKIVWYALQLELFRRTREQMAARAANNNTARSAELRGTKETPNCGLVDGPDGPVVINKKLLQRDLCATLMPLEYSQYTLPGAMDPPRPARARANITSTTARAQDATYASDSSSADNSNVDYVDDSSSDSGSSGSSSSSSRSGGMSLWDRGLSRLLGENGALRLPTPLAPLDFTMAPLLTGGAGRGLLRAPLELQNALLGRRRQQQSGSQSQSAADDGEVTEVSEEDPASPSAADDEQPSLRAVRPNPDNINRILERALKNVDVEEYNNALSNELEMAILRADRVSGVLESTANATELRRRGGDVAVQTAQALKASTDTYTEVLRAGNAAIKRFGTKQMQNWTSEWLKAGGVKEELRGQDKAGKKNKGGPVNRFVWLFSRVRMTFRFSATDGFQLSFIQWIYSWNDVNQIITVAQGLQKLDASMNNGRRRRRVRSSEDGTAGGDDSQSADAQSAQDEPPAVRSAVGGGVGTGARTRGLLPTGETPAEWMKRVRGDAEALAKGALSRIPIDHTIGINRARARAADASQMGG